MRGGAAGGAGLTVTFVARGRVRLEHALADPVTGITVPRGFVFDGGSIPPIAWPIVGHPYSGSALIDFAVHDYLCITRPFASARVHALFYRGLKARGVAPLRAWLLYQAVRWFGPRFPGARDG